MRLQEHSSRLLNISFGKYYRLTMFVYFCGKQGIQYETVSGFVCEAFGYIPKTRESVKVVLEKENWEEDGEEEEGNKQEKQEQKEKHQIYRVEVLSGLIILVVQEKHLSCFVLIKKSLCTDTSRECKKSECCQV